jgi:hypothetical protein
LNRKVGAIIQIAGCGIELVILSDFFFSNKYTDFYFVLFYLQEMIAFFRKIRRSLIESSATRKYLIYAGGEIILVVMGILIALQINNWNEDRKILAVERAYLLSLKEEFTANLAKLENTIDRNTSNADKALELTKYTGPGELVLSDDEVGKLLFGVISGEVQYRPSSGVLDEIISSGKLGVFRNDSLRMLLSSWSGLILTIRFQENEHAHYRAELTRIINTRGNARKAFVDAYGEIMGLTTSRFQNNSQHLLSDHEFDTNLVGFVVTSRWLNSGYYARLKSQITEIQKFILREMNE